LQLNPDATSTTTRELPIAVYESGVEIINGSPNITFTRTSYKIETQEAERIAVDHVAHVTDDEGSKCIVFKGFFLLN